MVEWVLISLAVFIALGEFGGQLSEFFSGLKEGLSSISSGA